LRRVSLRTEERRTTMISNHKALLRPRLETSGKGKGKETAAAK
jgi:hypothetical protein